MNRTLAIGRQVTLVETKLYWREPVAVFFTTAFPVVLLLIFGTLFGRDELPDMPGYRVVDFYVPALVGSIVGQLGLMGMPIALSEYREQGVLKRYQASPLPLWLFFAGHVLATVGVFLVSALATVLVAKLVFDIQLNIPAAPLAVAAGLSLLAFFALGFALAGLLRSARTSQAVGGMLYLPMFFLSGAAYPREMFPDWLQTASSFLPLTHVVEAMTGTWLGEPLADHLGSLAVLVGVCAASLIVARWTFRWGR